MKGLFIILLILSFYNKTTAQNSSINQPDSSKKFHFQDAVSGINRKNPLYIIDGKTISDTLSKHILQDIDPNDIAEISILKYAAGTALYGAEGVNGVIIVKTKEYQKKDTINKDKMPVFAINDQAQLIIDGQQSNSKLNNIKSDNILSIDILKREKGIDPSLQPDNETLIVTTKAFAIKQYQKKFSAFSKKYKDFVESHRNNDDSCTYLVSAGIIYNNIQDRVKKLYDIPEKSIEKVDIMENKWYNGGESKKYLVTITTRK